MLVSANMHAVWIGLMVNHGACPQLCMLSGGARNMFVSTRLHVAWYCCVLGTYSDP